MRPLELTGSLEQIQINESFILKFILQRTSTMKLKYGPKQVICTGLTLAIGLFPSVLIAQSPELFQPQRPKRERPAIPEYEKPELPPLKLPPVPATPGAQERLSEKIEVFVKKYKLSGNTVFTNDELSKITNEYKGRMITSEELQEIRRKLTLYYVNKGYINSGTIIPDQKVESGVLHIRIIEGKLTNIEIKDNKWLRPEYITKRISSDTQAILNVNQLRERLQLLQQNPLILRFHAQLSPGIRPGESVLTLQVKEDNPAQIGLTFANDRSPSIGAERLTGYAAHRSVTGWGDTLAAQYSVTDGASDWGVSYSCPLNAHDTMLSLKLEKNESLVVEEPFDSLDIESELKTYSISLTHPFYKTPQRQFSMELTLEQRHSETFLLGVPFSFSPGAVNGESDVTVLRFTQEWLSRSLNQVLTAHSTFSLGINALNASSGPEPDGQYLAWLGQFQWARRFDKRGDQIIFRTDLQLAKDSLLSMERIAIGGMSTVRGYRENQLVRDNALVASLEFRIPMFSLSIPGISQSAEDGLMYLVPFGNFGKGWNTDEPTPKPDTISSVGIGTRWDLSPKIHAEIYWGFPLRDFDNAYEDLQDDGIHFRLSCFFL